MTSYGNNSKRSQHLKLPEGLSRPLPKLVGQSPLVNRSQDQQVSGDTTRSGLPSLWGCLPRASLHLSCRSFFSFSTSIPWSPEPLCADGTQANAATSTSPMPSHVGFCPVNLPLPWQELGSSSPPCEPLSDSLSSIECMEVTAHDF